MLIELQKINHSTKFQYCCLMSKMTDNLLSWIETFWFWRIKLPPALYYNPQMFRKTVAFKMSGFKEQVYRNPGFSDGGFFKIFRRIAQPHIKYMCWRELQKINHSTKFQYCCLLSKMTDNVCFPPAARNRTQLIILSKFWRHRVQIPQLLLQYTLYSTLYSVSVYSVQPWVS